MQWRPRFTPLDYPTGPFGPAVVWPEERWAPIYHDQAIWPFVTAYWMRAAQRVGDAPVLNAGLRSLRDGAAMNLSDMENVDLLTGPDRRARAPWLGGGNDAQARRLNGDADVLRQYQDQHSWPRRRCSRG